LLYAKEIKISREHRMNRSKNAWNPAMRRVVLPMGEGREEKAGSIGVRPIWGGSK